MTGGKNINILLVEDDPIQLKMMEELLRQHGFTHVSVKDGHSALEKLNQETFNLVISDVNMPGGISGFNLVKTVRAVKNLQHLPFIFVTGRRDKQDVQRAIESGVDDYIVKPVDQDMLLAKIESLISKTGTLFSFSERPAKIAASFKLDFEIDGVSEQAIQFLSPIPLPENYKMRISAAIFDEIEIAPPQLRVACSSPVLHDRSLHRVRANFIGLNEKEMNSIRKWILNNQPKISRVS